MNEFLIGQLRDAGLIAILRKTPQSIVTSIAKALVDGGVTVIEVTMESEGAAGTIAELRKLFGSNVLIGAGTVLTFEELKNANDAGADFFVSPCLDLTLIDVANAEGHLFIPGVMTPTEVAAARGKGLSLLKLFPSGSVGPAMVKDLLGPFSGTSFICTGGITAKTAMSYIDAGAVGVGLGSALLPKNLLEAKDWAEISEQVSRTTALIHDAKSR